MEKSVEHIKCKGKAEKMYSMQPIIYKRGTYKYVKYFCFY